MSEIGTKTVVGVVYESDAASVFSTKFEDISSLVSGRQADN